MYSFSETVILLASILGPAVLISIVIGIAFFKHLRSRSLVLLILLAGLGLSSCMQIEEEQPIYVEAPLCPPDLYIFPSSATGFNILLRSDYDNSILFYIKPVEGFSFICQLQSFLGEPMAELTEGVFLCYDFKGWNVEARERPSKGGWQVIYWREVDNKGRRTGDNINDEEVYR